MKINGVILTNNEDIKARVCRAYQTLLTENGDWRPSLGNLQFRVLEKDRPRSLEEPFLEENVFKALSSPSSDKKSSPNSFTKAFWHLY